MKYYTRAEVAEELGITTQGIGKRLKTTGAIARCQKSGNRLLIPEEVMEELRVYYKGETSGNQETKSETEIAQSGNQETETETETETSGNQETKSETEIETPSELGILWEAYKELKKQLEVKDDQIRSLNEALINAQEQGKAAQLLQAADKREQLLPASEGDKEEEKEKPKTRFQRLVEAWRG